MGCAGSYIHVPPGYVAVTYPIHAACAEGIQTRRSCVFGAEAAPIFLPAPFRSHTIPMSQLELDSLSPPVDMRRLFGPITTPTLDHNGCADVCNKPVVVPPTNPVLDTQPTCLTSAPLLTNTPCPSHSSGILADPVYTDTHVQLPPLRSNGPYSSGPSVACTPCPNTTAPEEQSPLSMCNTPSQTMSADTITTAATSVSNASRTKTSTTTTMHAVGLATSTSVCAPATCEIRTLSHERYSSSPPNDRVCASAMADSAADACDHEPSSYSYARCSPLCHEPIRRSSLSYRNRSNSMDSPGGMYSSDNTSSSSCPQIDCIGVADGSLNAGCEETWQWWCEQVRGGCVTHDRHSCMRLLNLPLMLRDQHSRHPHYVEFDVSACELLRGASRITGTVLTSPSISETRWLTSLNLSDNKLESGAIRDLFVQLACANCKKCVMPVLRELHLSHMNLTTRDICCMLYCLFPFKPTASSNSRLLLRWLGDIFPSTEMGTSDATAATPMHADGGAITELLFPSLCILDLSHNPTIGNDGLREMLRSMLAVHYEGYRLKFLDLSCCGIDTSGVHLLRTYRVGTIIATRRMCAPIIAQTIALHDNNIRSSSLGSTNSKAVHHNVRFITE